MNLDNFPIRLQKLAAQSGLDYRLGGPASDVEIVSAESRLGVEFPPQVRLFYQAYNGLYVGDPYLKVSPVEDLKIHRPRHMQFATIDKEHHLYFDVSHINNAGQWNIVAARNHLVTMTMASFWSNKIWAWIEKKRPIWREE
jgi:cell wall assembly regulator SMI1